MVVIYVHLSDTDNPNIFDALEGVYILANSIDADHHSISTKN